MSARKRRMNITWRQAWPIWLAFGTVFGLGILGVWVVTPAKKMPTKALRRGEDVAIGVAELETSVPKFFAYPGQAGEKIEFFVEREAGDHISAAFASCRKCYRSGHYRQGSQVFCGRCNQPMERMAAGQTPSPVKDCTQIPIPFGRSGDHLAIQATAIADAFAHWYSPVIATQGANSRSANQN